MSCVRAAPTAAPAMRPATQNTVTAVGSTLVSKHGTGQLSHSTPAIPPIHHYLPYFRSSSSTTDLDPSLQFLSPISPVLPYFLTSPTRH